MGESNKKVIIVHSSYNLSNRDAKEVNEWLEKGWKVKCVVTETANDFITAIFVLWKNE